MEDDIFGRVPEKLEAEEHGLGRGHGVRSVGGQAADSSNVICSSDNLRQTHCECKEIAATVVENDQSPQQRHLV